jgi:GTPase involved in cell partitioning and DNA repair
VIDLTATTGAVSQLNDLRNELEQYSEGLSLRPSAIVANKLDMEIASEELGRLREVECELPIVAVSAKHKLNTEAVIELVRKFYDKHSQNETSYKQ